MEYSERILLDRYAIKDMDKPLSVGDLCVVSSQKVFEADGRLKEHREVGNVSGCYDDGTFDVKMSDGTVKERVPRHRIEYIVEKTYPEVCSRVSKAVAAPMKSGKRSFQARVRSAMETKRFIPAGRILTGLGRDDFDLTLYNCFVFAIPSDSRRGIVDHLFNIFDTYSRGGGCGWNLSTLRPRGAPVRKVSGRSSGSLSWAELYSVLTGIVEQGGSRKGAAMIGLEPWHPDIEEFIETKAMTESFLVEGRNIERNLNLLNNANVSVFITNEFMEAVEHDADWDLIFPDTRVENYDELWDGDIEAWRAAGRPVEVHKTVRARDLWMKIIEKAHDSGEPGLLFLGRARETSNSYYYAQLCGSNPCAEQVLPSNGVCNLGHLNLSKYTTGEQYPEAARTAAEAVDFFDWDQMQKDVEMGIRFLDNVIDINQYHNEAIEKQQRGERRVGLGFLGYGEALLRLGLRYGSAEALRFTDTLMERFATYSYLASVELAKELGSFPRFDAEKFLDSGFMKKMPEAVRDAVREHGIRNVTVNTIAPTGSTSGVLNTTGGCEPLFDASYTMVNRIGIVEETASAADALYKKYGDHTNWPEYVVTAMDGISPEQHVRTQATMQRWVDASISKTINLPKNASPDDVAEAYRHMWELGCKGGTVYVDGSRDEQVYYTDTTKPSIEFVDADDVIRPRIKTGIGPIFSENSPVGKVHAMIRHDENGDPWDMFITAGKGHMSADAQAFGRLISLILGWPNGEHVTQQTRLSLIEDQLADILGPDQWGIGPDAKRSLPDTIAKIIKKYLAGDYELASVPFGRAHVEALRDQVLANLDDPEAIRTMFRLLVEPHRAEDAETHEYEEVPVEIKENRFSAFPRDLCPDCHYYSYVKIPGKCPYCTHCGYTRCS